MIFELKVTIMNYTHENKYAFYELKNSILYITFKEYLTITLQTAFQIVRDRLVFQSYKPYPVICDITHVRSIDFDARQYLSVDGSTLLSSVALVSKLQTIYSMALFYIEVNTPKVPTQVFKTVLDAELFIKVYNN